MVRRTHQLLAEAPSAVVTATLEDALAVEERPNMPATTNELWPNWARALPCPLEAIECHPLVQVVATGRAAGGKASSVERVVSPWAVGETLGGVPSSGEEWPRPGQRTMPLM